ncbi:MAG: hypothetical protein KDB40_23325 [Acidimicrobiales bacterium]|nr:hypothetical protein [Acidimicrobiales bacterium]
MIAPSITSRLLAVFATAAAGRAAVQPVDPLAARNRVELALWAYETGRIR